jgi:hypothetical protein
VIDTDQQLMLGNITANAAKAGPLLRSKGKLNGRRETGYAICPV